MARERAASALVNLGMGQLVPAAAGNVDDTGVSDTVLHRR